MSQWTLFSNHGHVLLYLANDPEARLRDVASAVGITERAVQKIVRDLQDGGLVSIGKQGRRNRYQIHTRKPLRHKLESHRTVGNLVRLMSRKQSPAPVRVSRKPAPERAVRESAPAPGPEPSRAGEPGGVPAPLAEPVSQRVPAPPAPPPSSSLEEPATGAKPASKPVPAPAADSAGAATRTKAPRKKKAPPDDQQGSLF